MSVHNTATEFIGFAQPTKNYYRLPNDWFDIWAWVRDRLGTSRIDGSLKFLAYLIKHSWGYLNFDVLVRLTKDEFAGGRRRATRDGTRGVRMDLGTGLSSRTLVKVPQQLLELGLIERAVDDSDGARVKHYYLPRLRLSGEPLHAPCTDTLDTFEGLDFPDSNYFPVPFVWTNLTRDIHSAVEILAGEYLMRHTFGWRDKVRWLTPIEVATGRQRKDGTTYDKGIQYPRDTVASACEALVERGIFVWRPAERDIGRERREYALRMQEMEVDKTTGRWLGWSDVDNAEGEQSKPLTRQSTVVRSQQSEPLTGQSKPLTGQSTPLTQQSEPPGGQNEPRSDNKTLLQNLPKHRQTTTSSTPAPPEVDNDGVDDVVELREALKVVGIRGKKRQEILNLDDPPEPHDVYGWAYWAYAQEWADRNPIGAAIGMLLDPESRHDPPYPFQFFGFEYGSGSIGRALIEAYRWAGYTPPPGFGDYDLQEQWCEYFGDCFPDQLPLPDPAARMWSQEYCILQAGIDRPVGRDVSQRWPLAWQEFLSHMTPMNCKAWHDVSRPLGYSGNVLVVLVAEVMARVLAEEHKADMEAIVGARIQFTSVKLNVPALDEEEEKTASTLGAVRIWEHVLQQVGLSITRSVFDHHFSRCVPLAFENRCLTIRVPNESTGQWLAGSLKSILVNATARASPDVSRLRLVNGSYERAIETSS